MKEILQKNAFSAWISRQRKRDDVIGDLAQDVARDPDFPSGPRTLSQLHRYLCIAGADFNVHAALDAAWLEYQLARSNPRRPARQRKRKERR